ncbi:hypothetical protein ACFVUB_29470 [Streptomyces niveus]
MMRRNGQLGPQDETAVVTATGGQFAVQRRHPFPDTHQAVTTWRAG